MMMWKVKGIILMVDTIELFGGVKSSLGNGDNTLESQSVKALDKINALNLVAFDYIKDKTHEEIGLIAQEVLDIIPGAVEKYEGEDNHLTINYSKFVPYLIKAVQELNQKLEEIA